MRIKNKEIRFFQAWIILAPAIVIFSIILPEGESIYKFLGVTKGNSPCMMRELTGLSCGSCGLTAAFQAIGRGRLMDATLQHPLSIPLFIVFMFFGIIAFLDITGITKIADMWFAFFRKNWRIAGGVAIALVLIVHGVRIYSEVSAGYYIDSGLERLVCSWTSFHWIRLIH